MLCVIQRAREGEGRGVSNTQTTNGTDARKKKPDTDARTKQIFITASQTKADTDEIHAAKTQAISFAALAIREGQADGKGVVVADVVARQINEVNTKAS